MIESWTIVVVGDRRRMGGLQPTIDGGPEWLLKNGKVSAQAKLYGKVCTQGKW